MQYVQKNDDKTMYAFEIENRRQFFYPPFSRIIEITIKHKVKEVAEEEAHKLGLALKRDLNNFVVGPAAPVVARVRNQYLMELLIKLPLDTKQIQRYKEVIKNHFNLVLSEKQFKSVVMIADVDAN